MPLDEEEEEEEEGLDLEEEGEPLGGLLEAGWEGSACARFLSTWSL